MDLTATTFGLLVTVVGALFTAVVLLVRRELDHTRERLKDLDDGLRATEREHHFFRPIAQRMERKLQEAADSIEGGEHAVHS